MNSLLSHARHVLDGLLTALHIQLNHPSNHQFKLVVKRYLYALDVDKASLRQTLSVRVEQSTSPPRNSIGQSFAANVLKRAH